MADVIAAPQPGWPRLRRGTVAAAGAVMLLGGSVFSCGRLMTEMGSTAATVVSIAPAGGSTAVPTTAPIVIKFSRPMRMGAEMNVSLFEGSAAGAIVPGTSTWSSDRTTLTFSPQSPLKAGTVYVLRLGGGMMDADDRPMDYSGCRSWGGQSSPGGGMTFTFTTV